MNDDTNGFGEGWLIKPEPVPYASEQPPQNHQVESSVVVTYVRRTGPAGRNQR